MNNLLNKSYLYYFDTNAIYYFCGEDAAGYNIVKFREDMKQMPNKIIPSCVYQEMIVKFRKNTEKLRKIIYTLEMEKFLISPSQYDFLGNNFTPILLENLEEQINLQFEKKIDNEARMIYLITYSVSMVCIRILGIKANLSDVEAFMKEFFKQHIGIKESQKLDDIKSKLKRAYYNDDTEAEVKRIYNDLCFEYCIMAMTFLYVIKNNYENKKNLNDVDEYLNEPGPKMICKYSDNFNEYLAKICKNHKDIIEDAKKEIPSFFKKKGYTIEQSEYIKNKLEKLLLHKAKLEKNDIYDLFFLFGYSDYTAKSFNSYAKTNMSKEKIKMISFDSKTLSFISTFSQGSKDIVNLYKK